MKPVDYVAGKRYPTILRIHGGPVYQFSHEFMEDWQVLAANGYAVVGANPRGSSGRGFEFAKAIYADWGEKDTADVLAAVDHVVADGRRRSRPARARRPQLRRHPDRPGDRARPALQGGGQRAPAPPTCSACGASTCTSASTSRSSACRGATARPTSASSYPFFHADRITTPTLFLCNELDDNVPCIGSMQMYQALKTLDVPTRLVIYPGEYHGLTVPSYLKDRMQRMLDWYGLYLGVVPRP